MVKKRKRLEKPISVADGIFPLLAKMGYSPARGRLAELWASWAEVVGEDLAEVATPLGTRGAELLVGAENSMHMMELYYVTDEIRDKVNNFLGSAYFEEVFISLNTDGRNCLLAEKISLEQAPGKKEFRPTVSGKYLKQMDPDSPVARCYALFAGRKT